MYLNSVGGNRLCANHVVSRRDLTSTSSLRLWRKVMCVCRKLLHLQAVAGDVWNTLCLVFACAQILLKLWGKLLHCLLWVAWNSHYPWSFEFHLTLPSVPLLCLVARCHTSGVTLALRVLSCFVVEHTRYVYQSLSMWGAVGGLFHFQTEPD